MQKTNRKRPHDHCPLMLEFLHRRFANDDEKETPAFDRDPLMQCVVKGTGRREFIQDLETTFGKYDNQVEWTGALIHKTPDQL